MNLRATYYCKIIHHRNYYQKHMIDLTLSVFLSFHITIFLIILVSALLFLLNWSFTVMLNMTHLTAVITFDSSPTMLIS